MHAVLLEVLWSSGALPWWLCKQEGHLQLPRVLSRMHPVAILIIHPGMFLLSAGWSSECLLEWDSFTSLAIPSMLMMCIEWWTYEIGSFLIGERREGAVGRWTGCDRAVSAAELQLFPGHPHPVLPLSSPPGLLSVIELSAQSVIYEVSVVAFMVRAGGCYSRPRSIGTILGRTPSKNQLQQISVFSLCI